MQVVQTDHLLSHYRKEHNHQGIKINVDEAPSLILRAVVAVWACL
jgi:hypothetical protein